MSIIDVNTFKDYLPVNTIKELGITEVHQSRAWQKHFPKYIGRTLMALVEGSSPPADLTAKVIPPLAYLTLYESIPFLDLVLTGSGFGIVSNTNIAPASADRVRALATASLEAANNAMDTLLFWLQSSSNTYYTDWNKSSLIRDGLLRHAAEFNSFHDINESPLRFYAMKHRMERIHLQRFVPAVGSLQLNRLLLNRTDTLVLPLLQRAMAHYALSIDEPQHADIAETFLSMALSEMRGQPLVYTLYHQQMYEAIHENNEDDFPVFGV